MFLQIAQAASGVTTTGDDVKNGLADKIAGFFDYMIGQVPSWIAGFLLFVATIFIAKLAKSAVESRIGDQVDEEHQEVLVLAGRVTYFGTLTLGITIALKVAGIDLTTILAAVAFGIGFALQDLIMNFLAGVYLLVSRQFTIGDFIVVGGTVGKVVEIQSRATILKSVDGLRVIVPNAILFKTQVTSWTSNPMRRVKVPLYISYDTDIKYAIKVAMGVLKKHPKILKKPGPSIIISDYGDSTIDLMARFWVGSRDGWFKVRSEIMHKMWDEFQAAGIVVPYNTTHVEMEKDTEEYEKEAGELTKKRLLEMQLSKAIAADAKAKAIVQPKAEPIVTASIPRLATEAVPAVEPINAFADQEEIDGQG